MRPGVIARRAVLRALRRAGRGATLTIAEVAAAAEVESARYHLRTLAGLGLVEPVEGFPLRYRLTAAGKVATD